MNIDLTMEAVIIAVGLYFAAGALDINVNVYVEEKPVILDGQPVTVDQEKPK